ncbi:hypothetical protein [Rhodococcus globerulus]|uniref:hypothetical protein n=2 Tax=Nocardiaceae TaxID=85025 RepID=UPI001111AEF5|nr:hypothetical protein [Rhodococcus globerulus]MCE4268243.1 hypothetical protein [Rhodococcus globerulus]
MRDNSYDPVSLSYSFDQERVSVKHVEICDAIAFDRHKCEFQVLPGMSELDNQLTQSFWSVGHMLRGTCDAEVGEEFMAKRFVFAGVLSFALLTVGCSGESTPTAAEDPVGTLQSAAEEWATSFYSGDASAAYALFIRECQEKFSEEEFKAFSDVAQATPRTVTDVTAEVDSGKGTVGISFAEETDFDTNMPWVLVDGDWKTSDCAMRE